MAIMMDELIAECKSGAEKEVENELLLNMFNNENNPFSNTALNQTGDERKQIASKLLGQGEGLTAVEGGKIKQFIKSMVLGGLRLGFFKLFSLNFSQITLV